LISSRIYMISLGCPKNQVDAEVMLGYLSDAGAVITEEISEADVIIVNTCGFITDAKVESINEILEAAEEKKARPDVKLLVSGCLSQRYSDELINELPEVDGFIGVTQYKDIASLVDSVLGGERINQTAMQLDVVGDDNRYMVPSHRAYIKVAEGCDNRCTYCAIPYIRGPFRSRPIEDIIDEARLLAEDGVREIILIAQDTTRYGIDLYEKPMLSELLRRINKIEGVNWIRILYGYPDMVDQELIDTIISCDKVCKYIDIPLQHAADSVLKRMGRNMGRESIDNVFRLIKNADERIAIRTTFMVGFPGETDEDFNELIKFIDEHDIENMGAFEFSCEDGTPAEEFEDTVAEEIAHERYEALMLRQLERVREMNARLVNKVLDVMIEGTEDGVTVGRTMYQAAEIDGLTYLPDAHGLIPGEIYKVKITDFNDYDLYGSTEQ